MLTLVVNLCFTFSERRLPFEWSLFYLCVLASGHSIVTASLHLKCGWADVEDLWWLLFVIHIYHAPQPSSIPCYVVLKTWQSLSSSETMLVFDIEPKRPSQISAQLRKGKVSFSPVTSSETSSSLSRNTLGLTYRASSSQKLSKCSIRGAPAEGG